MVEKMDSPSDYVCRVSSLPSHPFPSSEEEDIPLLVPILRQMLKTKLSVEKVLISLYGLW